MQYQSVYDLIRRALPGKESCFLLREMKVEEAATGQNCYCVSSEGEKIILSGDCVISILRLSAGGVRRQSILVR